MGDISGKFGSINGYSDDDIKDPAKGDDIDNKSDSYYYSYNSLVTLKNYMDSLPKILGKITDVFANPDIRKYFGDDYSSNLNSRDD